MADYKYIVPTYFGSPWDKGARGVYSAEVEWPRVGIYCRQGHDLWLVGSFTVSHEVLKQRDEIYWGWDSAYMTGDGYLIRLGQQSGAGQSQEIVGDELRDREQEARDQSRALELLATGDLEQALPLMERQTNADAEVRLRIPLTCRECGYQRVFRSDKIQGVVSKFWEFGIREVGLREFATRVDPQPR